MLIGNAFSPCTDRVGAFQKFRGSILPLAMPETLKET
jgi:hypothetical protein